MEHESEVCLEEVAGRLWESGMDAAQISQQLGVDRGWVEAQISLWEGASPERQGDGADDRT